VGESEGVDRTLTSRLEGGDRRTAQQPGTLDGGDLPSLSKPTQEMKELWMAGG